MKKGMIFDLDGVLVSTDEYHYQAWKKLAEELEIHDFSREDNKRQRGVSRMDSLEILLEKSKKVYTEEEKFALAERKNRYYLQLLEGLGEDAVLPGAFETLKYMREKGIRTAVGSSSKNALVILEKTGILPLVDEMITGSDVTESKPNPEIFLKAAAKLGLSPEECLVAEDAAAGVQAAKNGGMKVLAVGPLYQSIGGDFAARDLSCVGEWEEILN